MCTSIRRCIRNTTPHSLHCRLATQPREVRYELHGHSEPLRISKTCQVYAGGVCPTSEKRVAVMTSEGRILFWDVDFEQVSVKIQH